MTEINHDEFEKDVPRKLDSLGHLHIFALAWANNNTVIRGIGLASLYILYITFEIKNQEMLNC